MENKKSTVLVIDDEVPMQKMISMTLQHAGYHVVVADAGKQGIRLAASVKPDIIVLDMSLGDIDGLDVIRQLREWSQTPIVACSLRHSDRDIVDSLMSGADDYLIKPFNPEVLIAKLHANLRRAAKQEAGEPLLSNGVVDMDLISHEVKVAGAKTAFTPKEYDLLRYFMINKGKILTHRQILRDVWGPANSDDSHYLRIYVRHIRDKTECGDEEVPLISTIKGVGYRMNNVELH